MLKRLLATIVAAAFLFFLAGYYKPTIVPVKDNSLQTGGGTDDRQVQPTKEQAEMLALVNQARAEADLPALTWNQAAADVAAEKARDMVALEYFDHTSPTYGSPFDMMKKFGVTFRTAGENLAGHQSVEKAHQALMDSPGHRENILNSRFFQIGIGIADSPAYGKIYVQMFLG